MFMLAISYDGVPFGDGSFTCKTSSVLFVDTGVG